MGSALPLPAPVTSLVVKRSGGPTSAFRAGLAEMNGWRNKMEDAHVIHMKEDWGFFGIFDGHGGSDCSEWIAKRLLEELRSGPPRDNAAMEVLALQLDKEYIASGQTSGSTGTFVIAHAPQNTGGPYNLRVGNIGDSRVLMGRLDGSIVDCGGTDGGITIDHKPDLPSEKERIYRTGGNVTSTMGVARVNGNLAVSRAFGDAALKMSGGPAQADHPVTAVPEFFDVEAEPADFLLLVCDGISEGEFPNRDVVRFAAEKLRANPRDLGDVASAVCTEALRCGSKDNLSCMVVLFGGGDVDGSEAEFVPGPFEYPNDDGFRKTYSAMAEHAGHTFAEAVRLRYDMIEEQLHECQPEAEDRRFGRTASGSSMEHLQQELAIYGDGPPAELAGNSAERTQWFANWLFEQGRKRSNESIAPSLPLDTTEWEEPEQVQELPPARVKTEEHRDLQTVVVAAPIDVLKKAITAHPALEWDDSLAGVFGQEGKVIDDDNDGTLKVRFGPPLHFTTWLPTQVLTVR